MDSKLIKSGLAALGVLLSVSGAQAAMDKDAIAERLAPVGEVCLASEDCGSASAAPAESDSDGAADGESIYGKVCSACHDTGAAGAPVRGDEGDWSARVDKGFDTLLDHAINGFNGMPARGGNPDLDDDDMHTAVVYMVEPVMDVSDEKSAAADESGDDAAEADEDAADEDTSDDSASDDADSSDDDADSASDDADVAWSDIDGEAIFDQACMACHATGAAGAPVKGNAEDWAPHIEKGKDTLYDHAINGFNAMPAKGGHADLSDDEVKATVDYMVAESQ